MHRILALTSALALTGCDLQSIDASVHKYAPIIGKDLLLIGDILVTAECSPALATSSQTAVNILKIVAPSSARADKVASILNTNIAVAAQLCPLVNAIQTAVGSVPAGTPSQVIPGA